MSDIIRSKIRDVYIQLHNFNFYHGPYEESNYKDGKFNSFHFVGRKYLQNKLSLILNNSKTSSGTYLVTGFRGMGKTSAVRKVIEKLNIDYFSESNYSKYLQEKESSIIRTNLERWESVLTISCTLVFVILYSFFYISEAEYNIVDSGGLSVVSRSIINIILFIGCLAIYFLIIYFPSLFLLNEYFVRRYFKQVYKLVNAEINTSLDNCFYERLDVNLSQDDVTDIEILRQFSLKLLSCWKNSPPITIFRNYQKFGFIKSFIPWRSDLSYFIQECFFLNNELENFCGSLRMSSIEKQNTDISPTFSPLSGLFKFSIGNFSKQRELHALPADAKEIESILIKILNRIEVLRTKGSMLNICIPKLVFIVDELDKIEPKSGSKLAENEENDPYIQINAQSLPSFKIRHRQEVLSSLLANLKNFLHTAKAKFIFIGGRELYDATLADIADRDTFYSSIFNEVIYVRSLLKDHDEKISGLTPGIEELLIYYLLPKRLKNDSKSNNFKLAKYHDYLNKNSTDVIVSQEGNSELAIAKVIILIQQLIIFLTYRSSGVPKKFIDILERFLGKIPLNEDGTLQDTSAIVINDNKFRTEELISKPIYLRLSYNRQFDIGFISNVYRPFLISNSEYIRKIGDKLLFSTSFIFDHLLKFHEFGFSWGNLELLPEIIMINKEPNLRSYINRLLKYYKLRFIRDANTGLHVWKYQEETLREIALLSKISSYAAAAFNFTLDESLLIKRHYMLKLQLIRRDQYVKQSEYIHSIGFLQTLLGDMHYNDKEFDDAIIYYTDSIQSLRKNINQLREKHQFIILLRNELKLSLALERIESYDSAFSVLRSIILNMPYLFTALIDDESVEDSRISHFGLKPYRSLHKLNMPFIALLVIIEKHRLGGLVKENIIKNLSEYVSNVFEHSSFRKEQVQLYDSFRMRLMISDYFYNIGNLLYYKYPIDYVNWILNFNDFRKSISHKFNFKLFGSSITLNSLNLYGMSLLLLLKSYKFGDNNIKNEFNSVKITKEDSSKLIADILSKIGDSLLSSIRLNTELLSKNISICIVNVTTELYEFDLSQIDVLNVLSIFYKSSMIYEYNSQYYEALIERKKMLHLIKEYPCHIDKTCFESYRKFLDGCKHLSSLCHASSPIVELKKYEDIFEFKDGNKEIRDYVASNLSNGNDIKELDLLNAYIMNDYCEYYKRINEYSSFSNSFLRVSELTYKAICCFKKYEGVVNRKKSNGSFDNNYYIIIEEAKAKSRSSDDAIVKYLETGHHLEAIYCLYEVLSLVQVSGRSYFSTNLHIASTHTKLIFWSELYRSHINNKMNSNSENIIQSLKNLLGSTDLSSISPEYHKERALYYYGRTKQIHFQGEAYKESIKNMYFLEDKFDDKISHFFLALERINLNNIDQRINSLNSIEF